MPEVGGVVADQAVDITTWFDWSQEELSFRDCDAVVHSDSVSSVDGRSRSRVGKRTRDESLDSLSELEDDAAPKKPATVTSGERRGRGRPVTTSVRAKKAEARELLREDRKRARAVEAEEEAEVWSGKLKKALNLAMYTAREQTAQELVRAVRTGTDTIVHCTRRSGNISGVFQRNFYDAAALIMAAVETLASRTTDEEIHRLNTANDKLTKELEESRKECTLLKIQQQKEVVLSPSLESPMETASAEEPSELERNVMARCSMMLNARIEGLKDRLLPEQRRIPLAADKRSEAVVSTQRPSFAEVAGPSKASSVKAPVAKTPAAKAPATKVPAVKTPAALQSWTTVVKRGKKAEKAAQPPPQTGAKKVKPATAKPNTPKLRPPRSSAIVLTLLPGAQEKGVTYESTIRDAKSRINLEELGISGLRFSKAKTGGKLLEIPGATSGDKADAFALKLRDILPAEFVRVTRPTKTVDIRLSGLDDSVTKEEVAAAVSKSGGCAADHVKVGLIRQSWSGSGTVVVKVPVTAAQKLSKGRLLVGWVSCRVQVLETKPLRCYRCMEGGHVREQCPCETDRSELCYRCGRPGHQARECVAAAPNCPVCADLGKPADHKVGSKNCSPPKRGKASKPVPPRSTGDVMAMDTAHA
ncbi:hypothetical protein ABMA27_010995 [Loxostege sticticalis]|uniref:CCHC-type domain-containing protein n=1 Tax=Loxostege sticticalis TaxID=481309 RepID=A0ABR3H3A9_LOXSC